MRDWVRPTPGSIRCRCGWGLGSSSVT